MSGLRDEAVEAMARAIIEVQNAQMRDDLAAGLIEPRHFTQTDLNEDDYTRAEYLGYAAAAFAALPAGVYVSDGKGKVTTPSEPGDEGRQRLIAALGKVRNDSEDCACDGCLVDAVLAALSATDTETR